MSYLEEALSLAEKGFHVFPLISDSKLPAIKDFPLLASRDPNQIKQWWAHSPQANIGISTTKFGDDKALVVVDVDNKGKKNGFETIIKKELEGKIFPHTAKQKTPTGGEHLIYVSDVAVKQGVSSLGSGLDIRSRGGYIVGAGSTLGQNKYTGHFGPAIERVPEWIVETCGAPSEKEKHDGKIPKEVNQELAFKRAMEYLLTAPVSIEGDGGDATAYMVAARVKDFGIGIDDCFTLMFNYWNDRCSPPWSVDDISVKVKRAFKYGNSAPASAAPEVQFAKEIEEVGSAVSPIESLNNEFAFVLAGGGHHILWETTDPKNNFKLEHLHEQSFHKKYASKTISMGDGKTKPLTQLWMQHPNRRSYKGMCFRPNGKVSNDWYNLWRGFAVDPIDPKIKPSQEAIDSVEAFKEHAFKNICGSDSKLFQWLIGYFAHLVQRPGEKPLVALVFRGSKGVGKNALIERIGYLLGHHFLLTSNRRYLVGNFNGHLENCLLFALDEAFWSGDKQAEGTLKDLITGTHHVIEHKGKEPYTVENCTRICILGNEEWLVPSSYDERRFAVFDVGEGRKQDKKFFIKMKEGMERGGYSVLLSYLLNFNVAEVDVNEAPKTQGLLDQKIQSLEPFHQWWVDCLNEGRLVGSDFSEGWEQDCEKERVRQAFRRYIKDRQIRSRIPDDRFFGKSLKNCSPSIDLSKKKRESGEVINIYRFPDLPTARSEWEKFIGHSVTWN